MTSQPWESEEELLREGGISAFPTDQEDIDEDALLGGSDNEEGGQFNLDDLDDEDLIEVEVEDDEGDFEEEVDSGNQGASNNEEEESAQPEGDLEESNHDAPDMEENFQVRISGLGGGEMAPEMEEEPETLHTGVSKIFSDDDDSDEDSHKTRQRFQSERKQIVTVSRPTEKKIPETLVLSKNDEAKLQSHINEAPTSYNNNNRGGGGYRPRYQRNVPRGRPNIVGMNVFRSNRMMSHQAQFQPLMSGNFNMAGRTQPQGYNNQMQRMGLMQSGMVGNNLMHSGMAGSNMIQGGMAGSNIMAGSNFIQSGMAGNNVFSQPQHQQPAMFQQNTVNRFNAYPPQQPQSRPVSQSLSEGHLPSRDMDYRQELMQSGRPGSGSIHVNPHFKGTIDMGSANRQPHKRTLEETFGFFVEQNQGSQRQDPLSLFDEVQSRKQFNPSLSNQQSPPYPTQQYNTGVSQQRSLGPAYNQQPVNQPRPISQYQVLRAFTLPSENELNTPPQPGNHQHQQQPSQQFIQQSPPQQSVRPPPPQSQHQPLGPPHQHRMGVMMGDRPHLLQTPPQTMRPSLPQFQNPEPRGQPIQTVTNRHQPHHSTGRGLLGATSRGAGHANNSSTSGRGGGILGRGKSIPTLGSGSQSQQTPPAVGVKKSSVQQRLGPPQTQGQIQKQVSTPPSQNLPSPPSKKPTHPLLQKALSNEQKEEQRRKLARARRFNNPEAPAIKTMATTVNVGSIMKTAGSGVKAEVKSGLKTATKRLSTGASDDSSPPKQLKITRTISNTSVSDNQNVDVYSNSELYRQKQEEMRRKREEILRRKEEHRLRRMSQQEGPQGQATPAQLGQGQPAQGQASQGQASQGQQGQVVQGQAVQKLMGQKTKKWVPNRQQTATQPLSRQQQMKQLMAQKIRTQNIQPLQSLQVGVGRGGPGRGRGSVGRGNIQQGGRTNQPAGRGKPVAGGRGKPVAGGRGKPFAAGRGNPMAAGRGNPMAAGRGKPMAAGRGNPMGKPVKKIIMTKAEMMKFQGFGRGQGQKNQKQQVNKNPNRLVMVSAGASNVDPQRKVVNTSGGAAPQQGALQKPNNRTVVQTTPSRKVVMEGLATSTSYNTIASLVKSVGPYMNIQMDQSNRKAVIMFQNPDHARMFAAKKDRTMVDLARVRVTLIPE